MKKYNLDDTMNESELKTVYYYSIYPRDSMKTTNKKIPEYQYW